MNQEKNSDAFARCAHCGADLMYIQIQHAHVGAKKVLLNPTHCPHCGKNFTFVARQADGKLAIL